jgi:hypothetical protein
MTEGGDREIKDGFVMSMEQSGQGDVYLLNRFLLGVMDTVCMIERVTIDLSR